MPGVCVLHTPTHLQALPRGPPGTHTTENPLSAELVSNQQENTFFNLLISKLLSPLHLKLVVTEQSREVKCSPGHSVDNAVVTVWGVGGRWKHRVLCKEQG